MRERADSQHEKSLLSHRLICGDISYQHFHCPYYYNYSNHLYILRIKIKLTFGEICSSSFGTYILRIGHLQLQHEEAWATQRFDDYAKIRIYAELPA